jgi:hypothetical protein
MKPYIFMVMLLIQGLHAYSQTVLNGVVTDAADRKPVPYVSIGVTSTPNGTVSNVDGAFRITLENKVNSNDTLKFSSIGYLSETFLIRDLKEKSKDGPLAISLKKSVNQLPQVSIVSKKVHVKIVGYDKNSKLFGLGFDASGVGSQAGIIIPITHSETNLQNLSFFIIQNPFKHLLFRMNLYELVNNKPGNNISSENILINVEDNQTGKVIFDLSKYHIFVSKDVLLTLEWIEGKPATNTKLAIAASVFGHTYYRQASQFLWTRKGTGIGISVKTIY